MKINDSLLKDKNNIHERINAVNASNKAILKTKGITILKHQEQWL